MTNINKSGKFISRLLFVPRCASCGIRLSPIAREDNLAYGLVCFCPDCMQKWQSAKQDMCHTCYMSAAKCTCTHINRKIKQPFIPSLFFYRQNRSLVQNQALFTAKCRHFPELFEFLAKELAPSVERLLAEQKTDKSNCILTWLPRGQKALKKYGHDQARKICLELSRELGIPALPLLSRKGGKEQKKLDERDRAKNSAQSIFLNDKLKGFDRKDLVSDAKIQDFIEGKTVIVVDDIITTGASMRRAILLLEPLKPCSVLCACVARCEIKSK